MLACCLRHTLIDTLLRPLIITILYYCRYARYAASRSYILRVDITVVYAMMIRHVADYVAAITR